MSLSNQYALDFGIITEKPKTALTSSFKSTTRSQKAMFTQRFIRDFNDLQYEVSGSLIRKNSFRSGSQSSNKRKKSDRINSQYLKKKKNNEVFIQKVKKINPQDYELPQNTIEVENREQQITRDLKTKMRNTAPQTGFYKQSQKQQVSTYGLSQFQVQNTIIGKIAKRYSHHIQFQKQPNRPENINKVWYKKDKVFTPIDRQDKSPNIKRMHSFKSNLPHNVFNPRQSLDKFYPTDQVYKYVQPRRDIIVRKMQKVKNRDPLPVKEGNHLDYNKLGSLQTKKKPLFQISKSQRKFKITRQIISQERGCYR